MEVDASLTSDLVLVALHDRDLQQLLGQPTAKVSPGARTTVTAAVLLEAMQRLSLRICYYGLTC
jgi:glycerophosphoryl diester phosphodiesterase